MIRLFTDSGRGDFSGHRNTSRKGTRIKRRPAARQAGLSELRTKLPIVPAKRLRRIPGDPGSSPKEGEPRRGPPPPARRGESPDRAERGPRPLGADGARLGPGRSRAGARSPPVPQEQGGRQRHSRPGWHRRGEARPGWGGKEGGKHRPPAPSLRRARKGREGAPRRPRPPYPARHGAEAQDAAHGPRRARAPAPPRWKRRPRLPTPLFTAPSRASGRSDGAGTSLPARSRPWPLRRVEPAEAAGSQGLLPWRSLYRLRA